MTLSEAQGLAVSFWLGGPVSGRGQVGRTGVCFNRKTPISCPHRDSPLPYPRKGMFGKSGSLQRVEAGKATDSMF